MNVHPEETSPQDIGPTVTVKVFGGLRDSADRSSLRVPIRAGTTVDGLLSLLDATQPALAGALRHGLSEGYLNVLVNGRNARFLTGGATVLTDGDAVAFLPPIGGG